MLGCLTKARQPKGYKLGCLILKFRQNGGVNGLGDGYFNEKAD